MKRGEARGICSIEYHPIVWMRKCTYKFGLIHTYFPRVSPGAVAVNSRDAKEYRSIDFPKSRRDMPD
jgi:hypothetical protein